MRCAMSLSVFVCVVEYCGCLNGGWCQEEGRCDCAQFQGLGDRCQIIPNHGQDRDGICRSWGQHHFETFDGMYYYFPGTCSYILAKDCHSTEPQYTVWVHNSRSCRASVYSCPRGLSLFFPNEEEIYISGYQVLKGGHRLSLPQTVRNVFIERLADYILVKSTFGFSLAWDGSSGVYLKMTEAHKGRPCGLCGNYNDDGSDDLSIVSDDIAEFGNSWAVDLPQERPCPEVDDDFRGPCSSESDMDVCFHDAIEKCSALLFFPFISCHENIDPNPFVASCVSDMCVSDDEETFCRTLVEYTRACSHVGYPVREWRDSFPTCADRCEDSFVHRDCISCCPPTCMFEKECLGTNLHCLDGCYCPDGLILQNGTCIAVSQCPCVYHGTPYPLGHVLEQGCTVCVCMGGVWNCTENNCTAECTVMGDAHVTTFDGRIFMHMGSCQYVLVKSRGSTKFTVTLLYTACGESQEHSYMVNIRRLTSLFVGLRSVFGLRFQYDWQGGRIYLQLDSTWMGSTLGLCGTLNGNLRDDFLSPAGMIEGTPQLHVNAWKVSSACISPVNIPIIDPCEMNQQNVFYAARCDVLLEEVFAACHAYVSPSMYHQQCRYQACRCGSTCLCTALSHYAYICNKHNVTVNFRAHVSECGMVCLGGMMYHPCTSACGKTCQSISSGEVCDGDCAEGCSCTEGTFYDHARQRCVSLYCHCYFMGSVFQPGEVSFRIIVYSMCLYLSNISFGFSLCLSSVCHRGFFNCTYSPCPAVCTIYSDRHYHTFDGLEYDYVSDCQVYLVKSVGETEVSIMAQNKDCYESGIVCMKYLLIYVGLTKIYFSDNSGKPETGNCFYVNLGYEFQLWGAGYYTVVHFPAQDLTILWDRKTTVHIRAGPQWKGQMSGLCGNFDMVTVNDMTTAGHMEVSNAQAFGDSWAVGQCESDFVVRRPCEGDLSRQPYAKRECGLLYSDVFAPCHNVVDVTWFYKNCLTDTCNCNRGGDCECLCTSIAAYAHKCCQNGVTVNWRSPTVCPYDCEYYNQELGEGPFTLSSAEQNDSACVFGANVSSGEVFPLLRTNAQPSTIFHFMITTGLYKDRASRLPVASLESAERPNYFLCVTGNRGLRLEHWQPGEEFRRKATFIHHQGLWLPGRSSFELHSQKGVFLTLSHTHARVQNYDHSYTFKISSSFIIEESSFVIPYRLMCEWKYHACASPCVKTCNDPDATRCQFLPPVEGCFPRCPKSMLLDEVTRRCVYKEDCTCETIICITFIFILSFIDMYPPYSLRVDVCSEYICFNGQLMLHNSSQHCRYNISQPQCNLLGTPIQTNTDPCCPLWQCPCRCSIISDLRVITFDGNNVALYDIGSYILVHLPREKMVGHIEKCPTSEVNPCYHFTMKKCTTPSGGTSGLCFKKLNITTQSYRIMVNRLDRKVSVNQITARLPLTRQNLHIDDTGTMYIINTPGGINIKWYHSTGIMVLQYTAPDNTSTRGLCGCCDGNPADDLRLPNGTVVRDIEDIPVFLHGWMVDTSEDTDYFRRVGDNCTTGNCSKCFTMLNQRPFSKCHHKVSPEHFCDKIWAGDLHYKEHECDFLAAYVAICYTHQICFSWRKSNFCPLKCPPGKEYKPCVNTCKTRTCQNRDYYEESTCSSIREECVCKSGTILHRADSAFCVTEDQCVCTGNDGAPYAPGEVWNDSLRGCCLFKCLENGSVVPVEPDCSYEPAPLCEREGEYAVDVLEEGVCCPKKICECNLTICQSEAPSCENGDKLVIGYSTLSCCPEYRCECDPLACQSVPAPICREDQFLVEVRGAQACCYSYMCVCESCIDPVPVCLPGEILAVDVNTTNHCCPQYHCVCDTSLCPEPSVSCAPGAVLVKRPVPDNPGGPCGCPLYHCSKTRTNTNTLQMPHYSVKLKYKCLFMCLCVYVCVEKAEVCLFQGVTILNPGQSMVQYFEGELCYTVQCLTHKDPSTGFYAMEVTTANCSEKCEPHQVYVPSSDPHVCCGSCKNISCSYPSENGTTEAGSSWVANCTRFDCMETAVGAVVLASGVVCPPFNDTECIQNGGIVQTYVDGCCKTCKEDGKTCKRVAIRTTIRKDDCRSNTPVTVYSCDGKCPSATIFNFNINSHARFCKCCRENGLQNRIIQLYCTRNATTVDYYYQEPMDCSCQWN
uniref:Otogelin-like protein n=1 Tax=Sinocyclocheilus rhinocerous TaxID=307959 RepID=A0A673K063_9TELE